MRSQEKLKLENESVVFKDGPESNTNVTHNEENARSLDAKKWQTGCFHSTLWLSMSLLKFWCLMMQQGLWKSEG